MKGVEPPGPRAPVNLRARWFAQLATSLDQWMRSPAFLQAMRSLLEAVNHAQALQNAGVIALHRWGARELWYEQRKDGPWMNKR